MISVFVYAFIKDLRSNNYGGSVLFILIGLFLLYVSLPLIHMNRITMTLVFSLGIYGMFVGFVLSFLWMSVLSFEVWCTIK